MPESIRDGTGDGNLAKVDANFRLHVQAATISEGANANKSGRAFNINTGVITLTSAADTPVLYVKNSNALDLHISAVAVGIGPTTGGSGGIPKITVIRNPTVGTTIDNTNDVDINSNRNYGSENTLTSVVAYKGATGETMTDGVDHLLLYQTTSGRLFAEIDEILPTGASIGVKVDPQASNTSMDVYVALICHQEDTENTD